MVLLFLKGDLISFRKSTSSFKMTLIMLSVGIRRLISRVMALMYIHVHNLSRFRVSAPYASCELNLIVRSAMLSYIY